MAPLIRIEVDSHPCQAFAGTADRSVYPAHHIHWVARLRSRRLVVGDHWLGLYVLSVWNPDVQSSVVGTLERIGHDRIHLQSLDPRNTGLVVGSYQARDRCTLHTAAAEDIRILGHATERSRRTVAAGRDSQRMASAQEPAGCGDSKGGGAPHSWRTDRRPCRVGGDGGGNGVRVGGKCSQWTLHSKSFQGNVYTRAGRGEGASVEMGVWSVADGGGCVKMFRGVGRRESTFQGEGGRVDAAACSQ